MVNAVREFRVIAPLLNPAEQGVARDFVIGSLEKGPRVLGTYYASALTAIPGLDDTARSKLIQALIDFDSAFPLGSFDDFNGTWLQEISSEQMSSLLSYSVFQGRGSETIYEMSIEASKHLSSSKAERAMPAFLAALRDVEGKGPRSIKLLRASFNHLLDRLTAAQQRILMPQLQLLLEADPRASASMEVIASALVAIERKLDVSEFNGIARALLAAIRENPGDVRLQNILTSALRPFLTNLDVKERAALVDDLLGPPDRDKQLRDIPSSAISDAMDHMDDIQIREVLEQYSTLLDKTLESMPSLDFIFGVGDVLGMRELPTAIARSRRAKSFADMLARKLGEFDSSPRERLALGIALSPLVQALSRDSAGLVVPCLMNGIREATDLRTVDFFSSLLRTAGRFEGRESRALRILQVLEHPLAQGETRDALVKDLAKLVGAGGRQGFWDSIAKIEAERAAGRFAGYPPASLFAQPAGH